MASTTPSDSQKSDGGFQLRNTLVLIGITIGIYGSFSLQAICMEKFFLLKIAPFPFLQVGVMYLLCVILGLFIKIVIFRDHSSRIPLKDSVLLGLALLAGQCFTMWGFGRISFFVGNLFKSSKSVSMLLFNFLTGDFAYLRSLNIKTWVTVFMTTAGIILFNVTGAKKSANEVPLDLIGLAMVGAGLMFDSAIGNRQRKILTELKPTAMDFLISSSIIILPCTLVMSVVSGEFSRAVEFAAAEPEALRFLLASTFLGFTGQFFIWAGLTELGPLKVSLLTGSRKILTVLLSMIIFQHSMNFMQKVSIGIVIVAMTIEFADSVTKKPTVAVPEKVKAD
jgi:drug/metabolite transporter (DMT)-like permease